MTRCAICFLATLLLTPVLAQQGNAEINVVVSIKPLQLIAGAIVGAEGSIRTLVPTDGSPHHYSMTPSDRLALESADLIVYVGQELETELHGVISVLDRQQRVLQLIQLPTVVKHKLTGSNSDASPERSGRIDPHIWLDSRNGLQIAAAIRDSVTEIDSNLAPLLNANFSRLEQQLTESEESWQASLGDLSTEPYVVYHDAIGYFEAQFELGHRLNLIDNPEIQPGIRHILAVRKAVNDVQPVCLFTEMTARQATIDTMLQDYKVRQVNLDLMGENLQDDESYPQLLDNLVRDFSSCLSEGAR